MRNWWHDCIAASGGVSLAGSVEVCPYCGTRKEQHVADEKDTQ